MKKRKITFVKMIRNFHIEIQILQCTQANVHKKFEGNSTRKSGRMHIWQLKIQELRVMYLQTKPNEEKIKKCKDYAFWLIQKNVKIVSSSVLWSQCYVPSAMVPALWSHGHYGPSTMVPALWSQCYGPWTHLHTKYDWLLPLTPF